MSCGWRLAGDWNGSQVCFEVKHVAPLGIFSPRKIANSSRQAWNSFCMLLTRQVESMEHFVLQAFLLFTDSSPFFVVYELMDTLTRRHVDAFHLLLFSITGCDRPGLHSHIVCSPGMVN